MTPRQFEDYVASVILQLDFLKSGVISRNQRFPGVRQPGQYEIDIAIKVRLSGAFDFLIIVECKNWSRPVDRPVVQKLAQTRDAIAAHKAAVVSPVGFTSEAVEVARANGIALWVLSRYRSDHVAHSPAAPQSLQFLLRLKSRLRSLKINWYFRANERRSEFLRTLVTTSGDGLVPYSFDERRFLFLIKESHASRELATEPSITGYRHDFSCAPGSDERLASTDIVDELGRFFRLKVPPVPRWPR